MALKNPGIVSKKNLFYNQGDRESEEWMVQRRDGTILLGGFEWAFKDDTPDDRIVEQEITEALAGELDK